MVESSVHYVLKQHCVLTALNKELRTKIDDCNFCTARITCTHLRVNQYNDKSENAYGRSFFHRYTITHIAIIIRYKINNFKVIKILHNFNGKNSFNKIANIQVLLLYSKLMQNMFNFIDRKTFLIKPEV